MIVKFYRWITLAMLVAAPIVIFTPIGSFAYQASDSCSNSNLLALGYAVGCSTTAQCPFAASNGCYFGGGVTISGYGIVDATISSNLGSASCGYSYFGCAIGVANQYAYPGEYVNANCTGGGDAVDVSLSCFIQLTPY